MMTRLRRSPKWIVVLFSLLVLTSCVSDTPQRKEKAQRVRDLGEGYLGEGNVTAALTEFLKSEKLYDKDPFLHYDLGLAYFAKQEFRLAIVHFEKAIVLKPEYPEASNALGTVYLRLEQWDKAIRYFENARGNLLYATPYIALNNLGEAYRGKKEFELAFEFYKSALEDNPRFSNAHRGLGLVLLSMGAPDAAVSSLEKAVEYAPDYLPALYDLGRAYAALYEPEKAIAAFKKVIVLKPTSPVADRARAEIKKLQQ
jgi:tetratricopeptide (TPR) repeat protein